MGKSACDDGVKHIERDLENLKRDTTCNEAQDYLRGTVVKLKKGKETKKKFCELINPDYVPNHICINDTADYSGFGPIPTHGPHRPNWASFGEYSYCPIERWQHNLEHGSIVMLYHPCLDKKQVIITVRLNQHLNKTVQVLHQQVFYPLSPPPQPPFLSNKQGSP